LQTVFGLPGTANPAALDALRRQNLLRFVVTRSAPARWSAQ
jgi:thiamine pyrophosphate-dependent acetolactate synthase large subunit-like protein